MSISLDLRQRIVALVETGVSRREAARRFQVSASSAVCFVQQAKEFSELFLKRHHMKVPITTLHDWFAANKISYKKPHTQKNKNWLMFRGDVEPFISGRHGFAPIQISLVALFS